MAWILLVSCGLISMRRPKGADAVGDTASRILTKSIHSISPIHAPPDTCIARYLYDVPGPNIEDPNLLH